MNSIVSRLVIVAIVFLTISCAKEDINTQLITPNQPASEKTPTVILLSKTETTVLGRAKFEINTTYAYDTVSTTPTLVQELSGNFLITYTYPSKNQVVISYSDNDTKKIYNQVSLIIDPTNKNVLKQIDGDKEEYIFEYDAAGFLKRNPLDDGYVYTYKDGNLVSKELKATGSTYSEMYTYTNDDNKQVLTPFNIGIPTKKLIADIIITTDAQGTGTTPVIKNSTYIFDKDGYVLTKRESLSNGGYIETTFEYKMLKR